MKIKCLAMAVLAASGIAQAALITESTSGVLGNGSIDTAGYFATAGTNLTGYTVNYSFSYDPGILHETLAGNQRYLYSNDNNGGVSASLTINGVTYGGNFSSPSQQSWAAIGVGTSSTFLQINAFDASGRQMVFNFFPPTTTLGDLDSQAAVSSIVHGVFAQNSVVVLFGGQGVDSFSLTSGGGGDAPEPSTMLLLAAGLMGTGYLKRRKV